MRIIAGLWKGHGIKSVKGRRVRPTTDRVRESWFSALGDAVIDARVVDLFAGSGALGIEAASRGASSVTLVEKARAPAGVIRSNIERLGADDVCHLVVDDVFRFLRQSTEPFDLALADPPYASGEARRLVELYLHEPFANELWLEHPVREELALPEDARTRRYGDTALTTLWSP
ncbi:MAG: 16S rRNA (guanine(966)-N(2))-methyltransferase RsmD [Gemmatimonadetes bacterium]|nr:16S rRNA (guanine(966)-N(2))-methyltransferase RsmD [Gemmatimonadota bacterium]